MVPAGHGSTTPRTRFATGTRHGRDPARLGAPAAPRDDLGRARRTRRGRSRQRSAPSGIRPGDRVVAYLPNIVEAVVAFHACASLGAVWSSCSPDFGVRSVVDRFAQIEPRILLAVDGYRYGGRDHDRLDVVARAPGGDADPRADGRPRLPRPGAAARWPRGAARWDDFLAEGDDEAARRSRRCAFDHPLWVLYSSGTTGLPEGDRPRATAGSSSST